MEIAEELPAETKSPRATTPAGIRPKQKRDGEVVDQKLSVALVQIRPTPPAVFDPPQQGAAATLPAVVGRCPALDAFPPARRLSA